MFYSIIWAILNGVTNIFLKSASQNYKWSNAWFMIFSQIQFFLIAFVFIFLWKVEFSFQQSTYLLYLLILLCIIFWSIYTLAVRYSFKNEKITVLQPYSNLDKIIIIILWYFIFSDASFTTFIISLFAFLLIIIFSIDYNKLRISKVVWVYMVWNFFWALRVLIAWYILTHMTSLNFVFLYALILVPILIIFMIYRHQLQDITYSSKQFYIYRWAASLSWWLSYFISIYLLTELWVVLSSLLSLVSLVTTLIFAYFLLWDKPKIKDIILSILVVGLILLWYIYK